MHTSMAPHLQAVLADFSAVLDINPESIEALVGRAMAHNALSNCQVSVRSLCSPPVNSCSAASHTGGAFDSMQAACTVMFANMVEPVSSSVAS